jgi:hypothetical protein
MKDDRPRMKQKMKASSNQQKIMVILQKIYRREEFCVLHRSLGTMISPDKLANYLVLEKYQEDYPPHMCY